VREKTLWRALYETAARAGELLGLDVTNLDLPNRRARVRSKGGATEWVFWQIGTAHCPGCWPAAAAGRCSSPSAGPPARSPRSTSTPGAPPPAGGSPKPGQSMRTKVEVVTDADQGPL
jgi:hypothetical protein